MKLTPFRLRVLRAVAAGYAYRSGSLFSLYESFVRDTRDTSLPAWTRVTRQANWLEGQHLIELGPGPGPGADWRLTDAGRAVLAKHAEVES